MRFNSRSAFCAALLAVLPSFSRAAVLNVPGYANPWLAGMPDGSIAGVGDATFPGQDTAPSESPSLVNVPISSGTLLAFSATGVVSHGAASQPSWGPEGGPDHDGTLIYSRYLADENGIADLIAPVDSLIGVFLDNSAPSAFAPPSALNFTTALSRDFLSLSPQLRQPFFIGNGLTSGGVVQQFIAPTGATRLFLGTMDSFGWKGNTGQFTVTVNAVPEPAILSLAMPALGLLLHRRNRRNQR